MSLEENIKCGNSLIDDEEVAGELAFKWEQEFPDVFEKGGFDIVIGNPPYGVNFDNKTKKYLEKFDESVPDYEVYIYFISLYKKILNNNGFLSYIFPNTFLSNIYGVKYREKLFKSIDLVEIVDLSNDNTFKEASVRTVILIIKNSFSNSNNVKLTKYIIDKFKTFENCSKKDILDNISNIYSLFFQNKKEQKIIKKILANDKLIENFDVSQGLIPYDKYRGHDEYTIKNRIWHSDFKKDETYKKELKGGDVGSYYLSWNQELWISYGKWLAAPREDKYFISKRILVREITGKKLYSCYTEEEYYNTPSLINIINKENTLNLKYLLAIINSNLIGWFHNKNSPKANKGLFPKILINDIKNLPIKNISLKEQQPFIEKAELMLDLNKLFQKENIKFINTIKREFNLEKNSKKLENWYNLDYSEFLKLIEKQKVKLSLREKSEWEEYFNDSKKEIIEIKDKIEETDYIIDNMVYKLYDLTDDEIKIIEEI